MKIIGITGGIASGKSTVGRMFADHGILLLDADTLVHDMMQHDAEMIAAIAAVFPQAVSSGTISRRLLSKVVEENPNALETLEKIIHPRVRAAEEAIIAQAKREQRKAVILDIPLLFETGADTLCHTVIAVSAPLEVRRARAFVRPGMTPEKWDRLVARQLSEEERCRRANLVIPTDVSEAATRAEVDALVARWNIGQSYAGNRP